MTTALISHPACVRHDMGAGHPECPQRLAAISDQLIASGLDPFLVHVDAPEATLQEMARVHPAHHVMEVLEAAPHSGYVALDPDTLMNPHTPQAALHAAGAVVKAVDMVVNGQADNAFCSVRPPGHHACVSQPMGFCFFNNVAVGVRHAQTAYGLRRIAVVDFDVHHGNGTENIFAGDRSVLMCSFFQHPFYPGSGDPPAGENMINTPVAAGSGGEVIREIVEYSWLPALERFKPQMIFISAGFDAHREDDLGRLRLVESDYAWMTAQIRDIARRYSKGRVVSVLEGGYNLSALGRSVAAHVRVLAGLD
jgi:acetoin utilization deacetylase AcuC-like enzyme